MVNEPEAKPTEKKDEKPFGEPPPRSKEEREERWRMEDKGFGRERDDE